MAARKRLPNECAWPMQDAQAILAKQQVLLREIISADDVNISLSILRKAAKALDQNQTALERLKQVLIAAKEAIK